MAGNIITFYSYKGETSRTMALANVAWILAANNMRVLTIDWDLEAPGLHRYFFPFLRDPDLNQTRGLINLLWDYAELAVTNREHWPPGCDNLLSLANAQRYAVPLEFPLASIKSTGYLYFLGAGLQDARYAIMVSDFDWTRFYEHLGGGAFFDNLREVLKEQYDYTLIDSRTGVADTSGICTAHLPDTVVLCFTYNRQSIKGVEAVAQSLRNYKKNLKLVPIPMRVEQSLPSKVNESRNFAREALDRFLNLGNPDDLASYWGNAEASYYGEYSFEETLAVFKEEPRQRTSLLADMQWLTSYITNGNVKEMPSMNVELRNKYLRRFSLSDPISAELKEIMEGGPIVSYTKLTEMMAALPNTHRSDLAVAFQNLSVKLMAINESEKAVEAAQKAVTLYRDLAVGQPGVFSPHLAGALNVLAKWLDDIGKQEEALAAAREAVELYRALAVSRPKTFHPSLALSLTYASGQGRLPLLGCRAVLLQRFKQ